MSNIRTLIVDDEPLAREGIRDLLQSESDFEIVGESGDGFAAIAAIESQKPDLLFLDVQMPELDGFDVIEALDPASMPAIVFVTAYDDYALQAFNVHALDYILKPLDPERFRLALARVRDEFRLRQARQMNENLLALLRELKEKRKPINRILVRSSGRAYILPVEEIDWMEAEGDYVLLHSAGKKHPIRETLQSLEQRLDPENFMRIHRSTIVNLERIKEMRSQAHGEIVLILKNGDRLMMSRSYRHRLEEVFTYMV